MNAPTKRPLKANLSLISGLVERIRSMAGYGMQMGGQRNMYEVFGWNKAPTHQDFVDKYRRQDVVQRIINAPVNALWSDPPIITGDAAFQKAWDDLLAQVPVFFNLQRLDKLAGLGKFAILVIGFDDGKDLSTPVSTQTKNGELRKILYLQPYAEGSVSITEYEEANRSPRFGLPTMYEVDPGQFNEDTTKNATTKQNIISRKFKVHHSRVLHVADNALESLVFGRSRLEPIYNVLDDVLKVAGGSAETFWMNANRGLHINIDKDMELDPEDTENLADEIDEYSNNLRRVIRTRGVDVKALGSDVNDPRGTFDIQMSLLAAQSGVPKRVLMGSEAGQLASQQDRANWAQRIDERIGDYGQPIILLPFLRILIDSAVLPQPSQMTIEWPDAFKMNPLERAQTSAQMARSAANLAKTLSVIEEMNQSMAAAAQPQIVTTGGGMFGNADPEAKVAKPSKTDPAASSPQDPNATNTQDVIEKPPLMPKRPPVELLTVEECRKIIGFGKHQPVFDDKGDSKPAIDNPGA